MISHSKAFLVAVAHGRERRGGKADMYTHRIPMRATFLPGVLLALCAITGAQSSALAQNQARGEGYQINVQQVIKHSAPGAQPSFEITFDYEFQDRPSVYVPGLGTAPAKGSFSYRTFEPRLEFMDRPNGRVIQALVPTPTSAEMGVDSRKPRSRATSPRRPAPITGSSLFPLFPAPRPPSYRSTFPSAI